LPNFGVPSVGETSCPSPPRALPPGPRSYGLMCHSLWALSSFGMEPRSKESLQVVLSPCCPRELPDVISENPSLDAGSRTHGGPTGCAYLLLPQCHRPSPSEDGVGFPLLSANHDFSRVRVFEGCRYFLMFRPPSLLTPQIVPTAAHTATGQPGLLHPGISCFVTSTRTGYANRPNTGN